MDSGGPFYVHISNIFYSGELWVVYMYMSHIYNKYLPWTMVVHFTYTWDIYTTHSSPLEFVGDVYLKWTTTVHGKCL
jgi:hypothetical protein